MDLLALMARTYHTPITELEEMDEVQFAYLAQRAVEMAEAEAKALRR